MCDPEFRLPIDRHVNADQFAVHVADNVAELHRYVARRVGFDPAEDIVADVFMTAYRRRDRFDPALGPIRPWLFGIATNVIHRHHRQEARHLRALGRLEGRQVAAADSPDPVIGAEHRALVTALGRMKTEHRDALFLFAVAGLTIPEIAQAMAVPEGTVKTWLHRGRAVAAEHFERTLAEACVPKGGTR